MSVDLDARLRAAIAADKRRGCDCSPIPWVDGDHPDDEDSILLMHEHHCRITKLRAAGGN